MMKAKEESKGPRVEIAVAQQDGGYMEEWWDEQVDHDDVALEELCRVLR